LILIFFTGAVQIFIFTKMFHVYNSPHANKNTLGFREGAAADVNIICKRVVVRENRDDKQINTHLLIGFFYEKKKFYRDAYFSKSGAGGKSEKLPTIKKDFYVRTLAYVSRYA